MSAPVTLDPASVEAVASRVAELLREQPSTGELVDAAEIARRFGCSREWAYENADRLGAIRLSDGPRARLRFDPTLVAERLAARPHPLTAPEPKRVVSRPRRRSSAADLLPIRGKKAA